MSDKKQKGNNNGAVLATVAAVGVGALAAFGGYLFGKYQGEEEARHEQHQSSQSQSRQSAALAAQQYGAAAAAPAQDDFQKLHEHECYICLRPFEEVKNNNEALHTTPCGHIFCQGCIADALQEKEECPVCRGPVEITQTLRVFV